MTAKSERATILVVDDNEANRALARATLDDEGYAVVLATNGVEALAAFAREAPACVLLDVRMPGMDGFEVCRRIRERESDGRVPVIFLTALRDVDTFDKASAAGGDDFLAKPVNPAELVIRVKTALELHEVKGALRAQLDMLKHQRDALVRLQLQKERLMAFVVHDLKNPVNAMDLLAQLLLRTPGMPAEATAHAAQIRGEARQLTRMILNLLDVAKADEGALAAKRADVDLAAITEAVTSEMREAANARGVELAVALGETHAQGDEDLLRRMLTNLVENAIRHAPRASIVTIATSAPRSPLTLSVADAGPGVPLEMRERVFEPFVQLADGLPSSRSGRGLGLAFCKLVAKAHSGRISVEDAAPGARFVVNFDTEPSA